MPYAKRKLDHNPKWRLTQLGFLVVERMNRKKGEVKK